MVSVEGGCCELRIVSSSIMQNPNAEQSGSFAVVLHILSHYLNPFRRRIREGACDRFVDAHSELGLRGLTYYEIVGENEPEQQAEQDGRT